MQHIEQNLLAQVSLSDVREALLDWSWKLPEDADPIAVTAAGDVLLTNDIGEIMLLDCGCGSLDTVAASPEEFEARCADPELRDDWFQAHVVETLVQDGEELELGQCYGYTVLPIFKEGSYDASNRYCIDALEFIRFAAYVHSQVKDMPDGSSVQLVVK